MKRVVIGLGFGDEGKGLVTDWLSSKNDNQSVVRYSGGHQVGHCVRVGTEKHIFSNFGSGTMRGLPTIWDAKTVDPVGFCNEYEDLKQYSPKIKINPNCAVTTPFEKTFNHSDAKNRSHGTMGVGFGATIQREEDNHHLFFQDLYHTELLNAKLSQIEQYYKKKGVSAVSLNILQFKDSCEKMIGLVDQSLKTPLDIIYESSQGLMLDMDYGIFPNVTRSRVGTQELTNNGHREFYLVTRAYQTRHGAGWCSRHGFKPNATDETNVWNDFQGEFKTRLLDIDLLSYALTIDKGLRETDSLYKNLVITCLDHLDDSTGYSLTHSNKRIDFKNETDFIQYIVSNLPDFNSVYLSYGPTAESVTQF